MDFQELTRIYDEHWRLIYEAGQTPPLALLVRMRALALLRDRFPDRQVWVGFGYGIADQILETASDSILALDEKQFQELTSLLSYAATQGDRSGHSSEQSEERFRTATENLERKYRAGKRPPCGSAEWIAVPIVHELFGQPTLPEFRNLRAVGVQWLRVELAHVTPMSSALMGRRSETAGSSMRLRRERKDRIDANRYGRQRDLGNPNHTHGITSESGQGIKPESTQRAESDGTQRGESGGAPERRSPGSSLHRRSAHRKSAPVQGLLDEGAAAYLSEIVDRLDELVPARRFAGAPSLEHLAARVELFPEIRLRGFSAGMPFLLQLLLARDSARPVRHSLAWKTPVAATGVLNGHRFTEVSPLHEKLAACARAGIRTVFVPGVQAEIAREIVSTNRLDLRIEGVDTAEEAGLITDRGSDWIIARKRGIGEQSAQAWFWYFRSPLRTAVISLAAFVLLLSAILALWPIPTSVEWPEGQRLVLKNWIGLPVAHPSTGYRPPDAALSTVNDEFHWAMLPKGRRLLPLSLVVWGSSAGRTDVMALLDWRGRVIGTWKAEEDPALTVKDIDHNIDEDTGRAGTGRVDEGTGQEVASDPEGGIDEDVAEAAAGTGEAGSEDPKDVHWAPFQLRETTSGKPVVLATIRSIGLNLTVLRLFENVGNRLLRRGFAWHRGHLEHFAFFDLNGDGHSDQIAMGWAQHLMADGTERSDLPLGERGRSVAHIIDLDALRSADWSESAKDEVPSLLESGATNYGLVASWSFPLDRATEALTSRCIAVRSTGPGPRFACFGSSTNDVVEYTIRVEPDFDSQLVEAAPDGNYDAELLHRGWSSDSIDHWANRLGTQVTTRTVQSPSWRPIAIAD